MDLPDVQCGVSAQEACNIVRIDFFTHPPKADFDLFYGNEENKGGSSINHDWEMILGGENMEIPRLKLPPKDFSQISAYRAILDENTFAGKMRSVMRAY